MSKKKRRLSQKTIEREIRKMEQRQRETGVSGTALAHVAVEAWSPGLGTL